MGDGSLLSAAAEYGYSDEGWLESETWRGPTSSGWAVVSERVHSYDLAGNRLSTVQDGATEIELEYGDGNRLDAIDGLATTWNDRGELEDDPRGYAITRAADGLEAAIDDVAAGVSVDVARDPLGAPVATLWSDGTTTTTRYQLWGNPGAELPLVSIDDAGNASVNLALEGQLLGVATGASLAPVATDAMGTVVLDASGFLGVPEAFGTGAESSSVAQAYAGLESIPEMPYQLARARAYDPTTGRFASQDPIGLAGGDHRFAYAASQPTGFSDPSGLAFGRARPVSYSIAVEDPSARSEAAAFAEYAAYASWSAAAQARFIASHPGWNWKCISCVEADPSRLPTGMLPGFATETLRPGERSFHDFEALLVTARPLAAGPEPSLDGLLDTLDSAGFPTTPDAGGGEVATGGTGGGAGGGGGGGGGGGSGGFAGFGLARTTMDMDDAALAGVQAQLDAVQGLLSQLGDRGGLLLEHAAVPMVQQRLGNAAAGANPMNSRLARRMVLWARDPRAAADAGVDDAVSAIPVVGMGRQLGNLPDGAYGMVQWWHSSRAAASDAYTVFTGTDQQALAAAMRIPGRANAAEEGIDRARPAVEFMVAMATMRGGGGPKARAYSVAYETRIPPVGAGTRPAHNAAANAALRDAMGDPVFAAAMDVIGVSVPARMGSSPTGWTWHHLPTSPGTMQLVPTAQHTAREFQHLLHPGGVGGFALWGAEY